MAGCITCKRCVYAQYIEYEDTGDCVYRTCRKYGNQNKVSSRGVARCKACVVDGGGWSAEEEQNENTQ